MAREAVLVAFEPFAEITLFHEPAANEQVEGPINGRLADPLATVTQRTLEIVHR